MPPKPSKAKKEAKAIAVSQSMLQHELQSLKTTMLREQRAAISAATRAKPKLSESIANGAKALVGHAARWILGDGDYKVPTSIPISPSYSPGPKYSSHSYFQELQGNLPQFKQGGKPGDVEVCFSEYIGPLHGTTAFTNTTYDINPANSRLFPVLHSIAQCFEEWEPAGMVVHYTPRMSAVSTGVLGVVAIGTDYDVSEPPFTNLVTMLNHQFSVDGPPTEPMNHGIECKPNENPFRVFYVENEGVARDPRTVNLGRLQVATEGNPTTGIMGDLWVIYKIRFKKLQSPADTGTFAIWSRTTNKTGMAAGSQTYRSMESTSTGGQWVRMIGADNVTLRPAYSIRPFEVTSTSVHAVPVSAMISWTLSLNFSVAQTFSSLGTSPPTYPDGGSELLAIKVGGNYYGSTIDLGALSTTVLRGSSLNFVNMPDAMFPDATRFIPGDFSFTTTATTNVEISETVTITTLPTGMYYPPSFEMMEMARSNPALQSILRARFRGAPGGDARTPEAALDDRSDYFAASPAAPNGAAVAASSASSVCSQDDFVDRLTNDELFKEAARSSAQAPAADEVSLSERMLAMAALLGRGAKPTAQASARSASHK